MLGTGGTGQATVVTSCERERQRWDQKICYKLWNIWLKTVIIKSQVYAVDKRPRNLRQLYWQAVKEKEKNVDNFENLTESSHIIILNSSMYIWILKNNRIEISLFENKYIIQYGIHLCFLENISILLRWEISLNNIFNPTFFHQKGYNIQILIELETTGSEQFLPEIQFTTTMIMFDK